MAIIISFANQKGGVGKTTSAVNVAANLGHLGYNTLIADLDPQGNASSAVGVDRAKKNVYNVLFEDLPCKDAVIRTKFKGLSVLPSDLNLASADMSLADIQDREFVLKKKLEEVKDEYDYIIIDCPPSLSLITINTLTASDYVAVPMQCEYFALEGLSQLMFTIKNIQRLYNPSLELIGIMLTMYDGRLNLSIQVMEEIQKHFPDKVFSHSIPRNVRLSEAPSHGKPILYYDKFSKGSLSYMEVTRELIKRSEK